MLLMGADQYAKRETWHRWRGPREALRRSPWSQGPDRSLMAKAKTISDDPARPFPQATSARASRAARTSRRCCRRPCSTTSASKACTLMDIRKKQRAVVDALEDVKGRDIVVFNVARQSAYFERVVIASGDSNRQVNALADHVQDEAQGAGREGARRRGPAQRRMGAGGPGRHRRPRDAPAVRSYYNLEELWGGKEVKMKPAPKRKARRPRRSKARPWQDCTSSPSQISCPPGPRRRATSTSSACRAATKCAWCSSSLRRGKNPQGNSGDTRLVALDERGKDLTTEAVRRAARRAARRS